MKSKIGDKKIIFWSPQPTVNWEAKGVDNLTPLQMATDGKYKATAQLLLHYGANCNIKDNHGLFPIEQAMANKVLNTFKLLAFFN